MRYVVIVAVAGLISAPSAIASMELSDKYECTDCHRLELKAGEKKKKKEGPTYMEMAKEYKGKAGIEKQFVDCILNGCKGKWGKKSEMEAEDIPPKDAEAIAKWILTL